MVYHIHYRQNKWQLTFLAFILFSVSTAVAQTCSATVKCATGCCSSFGFCGTDAAHCGAGCLSTCDYKLGCDANNPCKAGTGCCNKFGFCGLGPDCELSLVRPRFTITDARIQIVRLRYVSQTAAASLTVILAMGHLDSQKWKIAL